MRKIYIVLLALSMFCFCRTASAQSMRAASENKRAQNFFVELGGQGLLFTANYDTRFANRRNGIGGRAGIGYLSISGNHVTTIPLSLNYLLGKDNHLFEVGLGATLLATGGGGNNSSLFNGNASNVIGTMSFSYRIQPVDSGFSFRIGLTPIFNGYFFLPYYGGLSFGYTF